MSGKGSKPRPINNRDQFEKNWDRIFGMKNNEDAKRKGEGQETATVGKRQTS